MLQAAKRELRTRMLALRDARPAQERSALSAQVVEELRPLIQQHRVRALHSFLPMGSEVDLYPLLDELLEENVGVYAPKTLKGRALEHYRYRGREHLVNGIFGTQYPEDDEAYTGTYDMILVPGLAFTANGDRLGYGAGYYDTFLKQHPHALAVAVCFPFQMVDILPVGSHDHPVRRVVSGAG